MTYLDRIRTAHADPEQLEQTYRSALQSGEREAFAGAVEDVYTATPDNLLFGAWHYRLAYELASPVRRAIPWLAAILLGVINGLILWWLSADQYMIEVDGQDHLPLFLLVWAPISAVFVLALLVAGGAKAPRRAVLLAATILALGAYPLWAHTLIGDATLERHYLDQMVPHLALLAWATVGVFVLRERADPPNRFAFLIKSLEIFIMAGLFAIAGSIFTGITAGLFEALAITLPDVVMRLILVGGFGLIPVLAVTVIYDAAAAPAAQSFDEGLSKVIATLMRVLLPLTLGVLVVYLGFIPFRFWEPFPEPRRADRLQCHALRRNRAAGGCNANPADGAGARSARLAAAGLDRGGAAGGRSQSLRAGGGRLPHVGRRYHAQSAANSSPTPPN
jgi:hypothetical protein